MGPIGIKMCPKCLTRVMPRQDGLCPACKVFDFNKSPSDEATVRSAMRVAEEESAARLYEAATLHWRLIALIAAMVACVGLWLWMVLIGATLHDREQIGVALLLAGTLAFVVAAVTAMQLSNLLQVRYRGRRTAHVIVLVLADSMTFFQDHGVPLGTFGPQMKGMRKPSDDMEG
jgi:hypothetical protein